LLLLPLEEAEEGQQQGVCEMQCGSVLFYEIFQDNKIIF
jgi:hypothetical protein